MARPFSIWQVLAGTATTVFAVAIIYTITWLGNNLVFAADLAAGIKSGLEPIELQVKANTTLLTTSIRNGLRSDIRDLRKEIQDMTEQRANESGVWSDVHEALLDEWVEEQEQLEDQLDELNNPTI